MTFRQGSAPSSEPERLRESLKETRGRSAWDARARLVAEYLARTGRLAPLFPRARPLPDLPAYRTPDAPQNLALELTRSILCEHDSIDPPPLASADSLWNGKPQQYFESLTSADAPDARDYDEDSLAP